MQRPVRIARVGIAGVLAMLGVVMPAACTPEGQPAPAAVSAPVAVGTTATTQAAVHPLVVAARRQIGVTTEYDAAYRGLAYPGGDVPMKTGVCADVIVRTLRTQNIDLQKLVHEDMAAHFAEYPRKWNLTAPDKNIDHRRVWNLMAYFTRHDAAVPISQKGADYLPGDIVAWDLSGHGLTHIGIVSDRKTADGTPLIIHNIGSGAQESDILFNYAILGHYRVAIAAARER